MTFKYGVWCKIGAYLSFALTIGNIYLCTSDNLALQSVWQAILNPVVLTIIYKKKYSLFHTNLITI